MKKVFILDANLERLKIYSEVLKSFEEFEIQSFNSSSLLFSTLESQDYLNYVIFESTLISGDPKTFFERLKKNCEKLKFESIIINEEPQTEINCLALKYGVYCCSKRPVNEIELANLKDQLKQMIKGYGLFPSYNI